SEERPALEPNRENDAAAPGTLSQAVNEWTDSELVEAIRNGSCTDEAFEELFVKRYETRLRGYFRRLLGQVGKRDLVEDMIQELYLKFLRKGALNSFDTARRFWPYYKRVAYNLCVSNGLRGKKNKTSPRPLDENVPHSGPGAEDVVASSEEVQRI